MSRRTMMVTAGIMLSLFMAAVEGTVVATAMPTIVAELGGLATYSWVFSVYMLTSTTTVPLYGKISDLYGRRPVFFVAMALFLTGSILSGLSSSMTQLIAFRALQGLGAGGLLPLAFIMIGDMFNFEQRARMQGLFSGVWGIASVIGPLLGGFLVDQLSWHWVFFVNVIPGILATLFVGFGWQDRRRDPAAARPSIDYLGAALLTVTVVALLFGLFELGSPLSWVLIAASVLMFVLLLLVERRAADPILPLDLFRDRLFAVTTGQGLLAGWAMFGSTNYVPLYGQAVLGISATAAGAALAPSTLGWVAASIVGSRLLLRFGYRSIAVAGMISLVIGAFMMERVTAGGHSVAAMPAILASMALMGVGMGLSIPAFMIAVQSSVARRLLGTATATVQFSRSIGGTLGVSIMGLILTSSLAANLAAAGLDPNSVSLGDLIDPQKASATVAAIEGPVRDAMALAISNVFVAALIASVLALAVTLLAPRERITQDTGMALGPTEIEPGG